MTKQEQILKEADYYLENDVSIDDASSALNISRRTFQLHMKKLKEISPAKFKLVQEKKEGNIKQGNAKGGTIGKRGTTWTKEDAEKIIEAMLNKSMTYEEASETFNIPKSTLYEIVQKSIKNETSLIHVLSEANRRGLSIEEYIKEYYNEHVEIDIINKEIKEKEINNKRHK